MPLSRQTLRTHVSGLRAELGVDVCTLYLAYPAERSLEIVATDGLSDGAIGARLSYDQGLTGKVARTDGPVAARDIQRHPEYFHIEGSDEEQHKSYLGIPLHHDGALLGVLVVQTREKKTFFARDIKALYSVGRKLVDELTEALQQAG
jgi:phosphotransferase system enzyme I (PtsP)